MLFVEEVAGGHPAGAAADDHCVTSILCSWWEESYYDLLPRFLGVSVCESAFD